MTATTGRQRVVIAAAAFVALAALALGLRTPLKADLPVDFRAFYCGGEAANAGADPYRVEPLRSCESRLASRDEARAVVPGLVVPAPLPAYDLGLLRLLAHLDFDVAYELFIAVTLALFAATVTSLGSLAGRSPAAILAVLATSDLYVALLLGQLAAIAVGAATLAALALARRRFALAGALVVGTCLEPHLGLPAVLGVAVFAPAARPALAAALGALALASFVALPPAQSVEYATAVLRAHVDAEMVSHEQLSATHVLWLLHVPPAIAAPLGSAAYLSLLGAGLAALRRLARGPDDPLVVLLPLALAPVGGAFIHVTQACASLPLLVVLVARATDRRAIVLGTLALSLLGFPWITVVGSAAPVANAAFAAVVAGAAAFGIARLSYRIAVPAMLLAAALTLALHAIGTPVRYDRASLAAALTAVDPRASAEVVWRLFNERSRIYDIPNYLAARAPTWTGQIALLLLVARAAFASRAKPLAAPSRGRRTP